MVDACVETTHDRSEPCAALRKLPLYAPERFELTWAGKRDAIHLAHTPARGTLVAASEQSLPAQQNREGSVAAGRSHPLLAPGASAHLFIEGENLEVLKLLREPYAGQVRMIYIDPPYNTGSAFLFPDNYSTPWTPISSLPVRKTETGSRRHRTWKPTVAVILPGSP